MLRFTPEQARFINGSRALFNQQQEELAARSGSSLIGNALPIPKEVWGEWDREAVELQRSGLAVYNDLAASVGKPMNIGKLVHYFQTVSDSGSVNISLDGRSKARLDQQVFQYFGTPLPIIDSQFGYGWRQMMAARSEGYNLDDTGRANATRRIAEKLESLMLVGDSKIVVGGNTLYGLTNHPKRNTRSTGVTLNAATGAQWLAEFVATLKLLFADNFKTPATIYLNWSDWFYATSTEYTAGYPKTIAQRVLELPFIKEIIPADSVTANTIIALIKNRQVLSVLNGMPLTTRPVFRANPEDDYNFTTLAAVALEIKFDNNNNCGIAVSS